MGTIGETPSGLAISTQLIKQFNMHVLNPSTQNLPRNPRKKIKPYSSKIHTRPIKPSTRNSKTSPIFAKIF